MEKVIIDFSKLRIHLIDDLGFEIVRKLTQDDFMDIEIEYIKRNIKKSYPNSKEVYYKTEYMEKENISRQQLYNRQTKGLIELVAEKLQGQQQLFVMVK